MIKSVDSTTAASHPDTSNGEAFDTGARRRICGHLDAWATEYMTTQLSQGCSSMKIQQSSIDEQVASIQENSRSSIDLHDDQQMQVDTEQDISEAISE